MTKVLAWWRFLHKNAVYLYVQASTTLATCSYPPLYSGSFAVYCYIQLFGRHIDITSLILARRKASSA